MSLPHEDLTAVCASVPADGPADEILASVPSLAKDPNVEAEKKRALQYTNDSKKPNVHIGLRYELVKDFRATSIWFKKIVYHRIIRTSSVLNRENVQQTTMLPRSEIEDYIAEDDEESQMALTDDGGHICPAAIGCIQAKHAKEVLNLPNSYDMVNVIEFGKVAIQWSKKLAFTDRATERRYVFAMGNFIEFELDRIGHIDAIFVHELTHECRLFVKITEAQRTGRCNPVLNLPLLRLGGQELIIGLPLINAKKLYIVPLDKEMVLVDWSIQYL
ncbi:hypothetical protein V8E54_002575 [Elaphomyces granulatus]